MCVFRCSECNTLCIRTRVSIEGLRGGEGCGMGAVNIFVSLYTLIRIIPYQFGSRMCIQISRV